MNVPPADPSRTRKRRPTADGESAPPAHPSPPEAAATSATLVGEQVKIFDSTFLQGLRKLGGASKVDVIGDLIGMFRRDAPLRIADFHRALEKHDSVAMQHAAHRFKSSCAMLGGQRLAALCEELENRGARAAIAGSESLLVSVEYEYQLLCEALDNYRHQSARDS